MIFGTIVAPIVLMRGLDAYLAHKKRKLAYAQEALQAFNSMLATWTLFEAWEKARPFLHVRQSEYSVGLVESMIRDIEGGIRYARLSGIFSPQQIRESEDIVVLLRQLLGDLPPGDEPPTRKALSEKMGLCFFSNF
jgi:hypothetical protein